MPNPLDAIRSEANFLPIRSAVSFARYAHGDQRYGDRSYVDAHLIPVALTLTAMFPDDANLAVAGVLHDVLEDTKTTYDVLRGQFGEDVAELVRAVTKIRNQSNMLLLGRIIANGPRAVALKLADRIANVEACWASRDRRLFVYHRGYDDFRSLLRSVGRDDRDACTRETLAALDKLWDRLDTLLGEKA